MCVCVCIRVTVGDSAIVSLYGNASLQAHTAKYIELYFVKKTAKRNETNDIKKNIQTR